MDFDTAFDELNILLGDTDNFTFTPEEKTRALTEAWRDRYVTQKASGTATYSTATQSYDIDDVTAPSELAYSTADLWDQVLPSDAWEFDTDEGVLTITADYRYQIPQGATLTLRGRAKLTTSDAINDTNASLIEYVLTVAHYNTLKLLGAKKTNRFIKNDTNMNEIIALRRDLSVDIQLKRQGLARSYERV